MKTIILFAVLLSGFLGKVIECQSLVNVVGRLAQEAYNSRYHSIHQICTIGLQDEEFMDQKWTEFPTISLHPRNIKWTIENAFIIVKISKLLTIHVLQRILSHVVDTENILLMVLVDLKITSHDQFLPQLYEMLFRRGFLNYCFLNLNTANDQPLLFKYDTVSNLIQSYDLNASVETIFPPFLRSLAGHKLNVLLSDNYPYAYVLSNVWEGMDAYILTLAKYRFHLEINLINLAINRKNALDRMEIIWTQLESGAIDIHMPRAHISTTRTSFGVAHAYEWESLVLVVPKSDQPNLTNIMLQPFSIEVWSLVVGYLLVKQFFKLLSFLKRHIHRCRLHRRIKCGEWYKSLGSVSTVGVELVSFLLIEAYLAKITEFLLYCRFRPDPRTLEEFFESDIRVLIPEYMDGLVDTLGSTVATRLHAKCVRPAEFAKMPASCCARIHTLPRAEYIVRMEKYFDVNLGRKQLYILPEHLKTIPMSYLLGRNFAFKNSFELFLLHVYESGLIGQYVNSHRNDIAMMERNFFSKGWLTLDDLLPLFVLVVSGWCCSFIAFVFEVVVLQYKRYVGRNFVQTFNL